MSKIHLYQDNPAIDIVTGACPHDCPDTCSWQVAVERDSGKAVDIWGHADHPVTRGKLCGKVDRYLERTYHADRLTTPLRRVGEKGEGRFEPVSWETAISEIVARLQDVSETWGSEATLPYSYSGTLGYLQGEGMATRFFNALGASDLARTICSEAGFEGFLYTIGATEGLEPEAFLHSRFILIWGSNTLTSNLHLWQFISEARKNGARCIVIDPAETRTARAADEWIPIRPGTDGALALAMMHVILAEGLQDDDYIANYTVGIEQLAERVRDWTPECAEAVTGIPAQRIRDLAIAYATTQPAALRINYGIQRHYGGGMAVRTIACLPALVGAWRHVGGGIVLSVSGAFRHFDKRTLHRPDLLAGRTPRTINMNRLGDALSLDSAIRARALYHPRPIDPIPTAADAGAPVKALFVYNANPAAVTPDQSSIRRGLAREDLFTVVVDHFQTDTADYADYLLPATTQIEHWDLHRPYGHLHLALNRPAIAPYADCISNSELFRRLGRALGFDAAAFSQSDEEMLEELVAAQTHTRFEGITWQRLLDEGFVHLNLPTPWVPFAQGDFPTPSGKCEFYSERMAADGYDPVPTYTPPLWQQTLDDDPTWGEDLWDDRFVCISPPAHNFLNSSFANLERFRKREDRPVLQMHPRDAERAGLRENDLARVHNERGEVELPVVINEGLALGTVLAPGVWWAKFSPDGRNVNQLTSAQETDMGASATFYDTLVHVTKVWAPVVESEFAFADD